MAVTSSPLSLDDPKFQLEARAGAGVCARLRGRRLRPGLWIADATTFESASDAAESLRAFARAFADAAGGSGGEVLVIESEATCDWRAALAEQGFRRTFRKVFVERRLDGELPPTPATLVLRSLAAVGPRAMAQRMAEASQGDPFEERKGGERDLDREWRELVASAGTRFDPARWHLVDDDAGPVGVVLPQPVNAETGTLYYVGVVPARRGAGLGGDLHALGMHRLGAEGLIRYVGSTDVRNAAMRAVFRRNGAPEVGTEGYYRLDAPESRQDGGV